MNQQYSSLQSHLLQFFEDDGTLANAVTGYRPRQGQIDMSLAVLDAIMQRQTLVVEAGTGIGKTYAYLVPALLARKKTLVSTGTKYLQDQIYEKDLPLLKHQLPHQIISVALLKGRANYLCIYRIKTALQRQGVFTSRKQVTEFQQIETFLGRTKTGDITQIVEVSEQSSIWPFVTSTTDNCLGAECPHFEECFVFKARKKAIDADVVVVNHHLLCADLALKQEGINELLPSADVIIIDEAHQLAETAGLFFSASVGTRQIETFLQDLSIAVAEEIMDQHAIDQLHQTTTALESIILALRQSLPKESQRIAFNLLLNQPEFSRLLAELEAQLEQVKCELQSLSQCSEVIKKLGQRFEALYSVYLQFSRHAITAHAHEMILWVETFHTHITLNATPLEIASAFTESCRSLSAAWVFTSATLSVNGCFDHFCKPLGLQADVTMIRESPFNYPYISMLYVPKGLPEPQDPRFNMEMLAASLPVLQASKGRAFILFTSHQALNQSIDFLEKNTDFPLFIQGTLPKIALVEAFRQSGNGVLLGTASFWEGVDVKGAALSCVIIAKLPFASPSDPLEQARIDLLKQQSGDPFWDYQLPRAVIALKQGVGRLIRDPEDHGVLMIADPRLLSKRYGQLFLESLPKMTRTQDLNRVHRFFDYIAQRTC